MVGGALGERRVPVTCCAAAWLMTASEPAKYKRVLDRREKVLELNIFPLP